MQFTFLAMLLPTVSFSRPTFEPQVSLSPKSTCCRFFCQFVACDQLHVYSKLWSDSLYFYRNFLFTSLIFVFWLCNVHKCRNVDLFLRTIEHLVVEIESELCVNS